MGRTTVFPGKWGIAIAFFLVAAFTGAACLTAAPQSAAASTKQASIAAIKSPQAATAVVKADKVAGAKGYQFKVALNRSFTKGVKSKAQANRACTFSKLKQGKIYYAKVRPYKIAKGKKAFMKWSSVKKVKVGKRYAWTGSGTFQFDGFWTKGNTGALRDGKLVITGPVHYKPGAPDTAAYPNMTGCKKANGTHVFRVNDATRYFALDMDGYERELDESSFANVVTGHEFSSFHVTVQDGSVVWAGEKNS